MNLNRQINRAGSNNNIPTHNLNQNPYMMDNQQLFNQPMGNRQLQTNLNVSKQMITVEKYELSDKIKQIMMVGNPDDRTEALGETLFYFLLAFIPQYNLNITKGKMDDTTVCSKLTGILIRTDEKNLLEIVSRTDKLEAALREVMNVRII